MTARATLMPMAIVAVTRFALAAGGTAILPDGSCVVVDETQLQELQSAKWPGWLALRLDAAGPPEVEPRSMAAFDDGQRMAGEFDVAGDQLRWRNRDLGWTSLDLERLAWIGPPELMISDPPARDRVTLVNGDRLEGFVNALRADRGIEIERPGSKPGEAPERTWHDLAKGVMAIQLVPRGHPAAGWRLWLRDGSVLDVDAWQRVGERAVLTGCHLPGAASPISIPWRSIRAVQDPRRSVRALASRRWTSEDVPGTPRLAPASADAPELPASLEMRPLDLHGPGTFAAEVPKGCLVTVRLEAPPELAKDTDCVAVMMDGDRVVASGVVRGSSAPLQVKDTIQSGRLVVKIEAGPRGAYGSSVRLADGLVLEPLSAPTAATPVPSSAPAKPSAPSGPGSS